MFDCPYTIAERRASQLDIFGERIVDPRIRHKSRLRAGRLARTKNEKE